VRLGTLDLIGDKSREVERRVFDENALGPCRLERVTKVVGKFELEAFDTVRCRLDEADIERCETFSTIGGESAYIFSRKLVVEDRAFPRWWKE